jgi:two-component system response regulator
MVHFVTDGAEALEYVFAEGRYAARNIEERPCVIVLDLQLPEVGGKELLRRVRADDRTKMIPVVIYSGLMSQEDIRQCYTLGANAYVIKSVGCEALNETLRDLMRFWVLRNRPGM